MNLTPLFTGLSKGFAGYRRGQVEREQMDLENQERERRGMLAIFAEQRAQKMLQQQEEQNRIAREALVAKARAEKEARDRRFAALPPDVVGPQREAIADDEVAFRERIRPPEPEKPLAPRNIDPLSPEGIKAAVERARQMQPLQGGQSDATRQTRDNRNVDKLAGEFRQNPIVKEGYGLGGAIADIQVGFAQNNGFGDLQAVYGMVKMFDPNSVVREGEIKLTRAANSLPGRVRLIVDNWNKGRLLTPEMRAQMQAVLDEQVSAREKLIAPIQSRFGAQARARGVESDSAYIAPSPFEGLKREKPAGRPSDYLTRRNP